MYAQKISECISNPNFYYHQTIIFTGLDPAEPYFYQIAKNDEKYLHKRIQSTDAELVDIIHTNSNEETKGSLINFKKGILGFWDPLGTVDFYVNAGGPTQNGCYPHKSKSMNLWKAFFKCSHMFVSIQWH